MRRTPAVQAPRAFSCAVSQRIYSPGLADTLQGVRWHLQYACPFRQAEAVTEEVAIQNATYRLRAIDRASQWRHVYGDICVTGLVIGRTGEWPAFGFRISEAVASVG